MTDATGATEGKSPAPRGEAAYKAAKEKIAKRNEQVRKEGRQQRAEEDRRAIQKRRDAEIRDSAEVHRRFGGK